MSAGGANVRVGAIGCGQFMSRQHIPTIAQSPHLVLEHLADLDAEKLARLAGRYHPRRQSTRWQDVVENPEVDVVVVGVLPALHPLIAEAALRRGKPVYVEKPLAPTAAECRRVQQLARQSGLAVAVGFNRRFAPATALLRQAFREATRPVNVYYRIVDDERVRPPEQAWKKDDRLLTETVHIFDLLTWLLGSEPVAVDAREPRPNDVLLTLDFADGSRAAVLTSSGGSLAQPKEHLEAVLDHGTVEMDDFVEVRSYGLDGLPPRACFAGRAYDGCADRHVADFARDGLAALLDMRRRYETALRSSGVLADSSSAAAWARAAERLGHPPLPQINYAADKGWGTALESFCLAARDRRATDHATPADGNRATACAVAARESIVAGRPISLDPQLWQP